MTRRPHYLADYYYTWRAAVFYAVRDAERTGVRQRVFRGQHPRDPRVHLVWRVEPIKENQ